MRHARHLQIAEFVRHQGPGPSVPPPLPFPASLLEHCQQLLTPTAPHPRAVNQAGMTRLVADADDLLLHARRSLHSLAFQRSGVQCPSSETVAWRGFQNGAAAAPARAGQDDAAARLDSVHLLPEKGLGPQSLQGELTTRLITASRLRNAASDLNGVLHCLSTCVW